MPKFLAIPFVAAGCVVLAAGPALAAVTFNEDGSGFIGRGDVITYAGKAGLVPTPDVRFTESSKTKYTQECKDEVGNKGKIVEHTAHDVIVRNVNAKVVYEARQAKGNGNISGYVLSGFGSTVKPAEAAPTDLCAEKGWDADGDVLAEPFGVTAPPELTFNGVVIPHS